MIACFTFWIHLLCQHFFFQEYDSVWINKAPCSPHPWFTEPHLSFYRYMKTKKPTGVLSNGSFPWTMRTQNWKYANECILCWLLFRNNHLHLFAFGVSFLLGYLWGKPINIHLQELSRLSFPLEVLFVMADYTRKPFKFGHFARVAIYWAFLCWSLIENQGSTTSWDPEGPFFIPSF